MAIEVVKAKGLANKSGVKMLVHGYSGSGKSSQFKYTGKTLLISLERGELVLNNCDNVDVIRVSSLNEVKEAYLYAKDNINKYDTIGIDSISDLGELIVAELKASPEYSDLSKSMPMWMKFSEIMLGIAKSFRDLDGANILIIALSESVKNGFDEKIMPMIPAKKVQAKLSSLYDEVLYLTIGENNERYFITQPTQDIEAKDRSGKLKPQEPCTMEQGIGYIINKILNKGDKQ